MTENKSIAIENSFTLKFRNTTNYTQQVTLFKEGLNPYLKGVDSSIVRSIYGASAIDQYTTSGIPNFNPLNNWFFIRYANYSPIPFINYYPTIDDIEWGSNGSFNFVFDDVSGFTVSGITSGMTLAEVNQKIQEGFESSPVARNSLGQYCTLQLTIDLSVYTLYPLPLDTSNFSAPFGIVITYPYPEGLDGGKLLDAVIFSGNVIINNISPMPLSFTNEANGVVITDLSNVTYQEILQSQNGSAYDINSLVLNLGSTPSDDEKASQLLQPFKFAKRDVNGNEYDVVKNQLIDPYQDQYSYSKVDLVEEQNGERYILDGNTAFIYRIEPYTSVNLTFNYRKVSNSTFGTEDGAESLKGDDSNIEEFDEVTEYANVKILDAKPLKSKSNFNASNENTNKIVKNTKKPIYLLGGGLILLYLLTKTDQK
jgi:hypothetical protein